MAAVARLGALLGADEAAQIAAELRLRRLPHRAAKRAFPSHQKQVKSLLTELVGSRGVEHAAAVLDGISAVPRASLPETVWTTPSVPGLHGRTTLAVAELINRAQTSIYAATYSASWGSTYVTGLADAAKRGVRVTVVVDRKMQADKGDLLLQQLPGATLWTYALTDDQQYPPRQHAKFLIVDDTTTFVTSANFSTAAATKNLECGLLSREPEVALGIRGQLKALFTHGVLVPYSPPTLTKT